MADIIVRGTPHETSETFFEKCLGCTSWIRFRKRECGLSIDPKTKTKMATIKCPACSHPITAEVRKGDTK